MVGRHRRVHAVELDQCCPLQYSGLDLRWLAPGQKAAPGEADRRLDQLDVGGQLLRSEIDWKVLIQ
jgi:hypothetical protein